MQYEFSPSSLKINILVSIETVSPREFNPPMFDYVPQIRLTF